MLFAEFSCYNICGILVVKISVEQRHIIFENVIILCGYTCIRGGLVNVEMINCFYLRKSAFPGPLTTNARAFIYKYEFCTCHYNSRNSQLENQFNNQTIIKKTIFHVRLKILVTKPI